MFGIQPVALGEWKFRAEMLPQHLIAFPAGYADQRMTEAVADLEADRGHGPLQRKMIDPLGVVQGPIHIQDHGFDGARQCHAGSIGPATTPVHPGAPNAGPLMVTICYPSCAPMAEPPPKNGGGVHLLPNGRVMALTITGASAAGHVPASVAPPPEAAAAKKVASATVAAQSSAASSATSSAQQQAALNQLLVRYTRDQAQGADPRILSALGKQITAAAKALGQHVTLPHAPPGSGARPATQGAATAAKINVTA